LYPRWSKSRAGFTRPVTLGVTNNTRMPLLWVLTSSNHVTAHDREAAWPVPSGVWRIWLLWC
jgi:hypothetical protein